MNEAPNVTAPGDCMNMLASTVCDASRTALAQSLIACSLFRTGTGYDDDDDDDGGDDDDDDDDDDDVPDSVALVIIPVSPMKNVCTALLSVLGTVLAVSASAPTSAPAPAPVATISAFAPSFGSASPGGGALK